MTLWLAAASDGLEFLWALRDEPSTMALPVAIVIGDGRGGEELRLGLGAQPTRIVPDPLVLDEPAAAPNAAIGGRRG